MTDSDAPRARPLRYLCRALQYTPSPYQGSSTPSSRCQVRRSFPRLRNLDTRDRTYVRTHSASPPRIPPQLAQEPAALATRRTPRARLSSARCAACPRARRIGRGADPPGRRAATYSAPHTPPRPLQRVPPSLSPRDGPGARGPALGPRTRGWGRWRRGDGGSRLRGALQRRDREGRGRIHTCARVLFRRRVQLAASTWFHGHSERPCGGLLLARTLSRTLLKLSEERRRCARHLGRHRGREHPILSSCSLSSKPVTPRRGCYRCVAIS